MTRNGIFFSSFLFPFHLNSDRCIFVDPQPSFLIPILPIPSSSDSKLNSPLQKRKATTKKTQHLSDQKTNEMHIFATTRNRAHFDCCKNSKLQSDTLQFRLTLCCCFSTPLEFFYIEPKKKICSNALDN